MNPDPVKQRTAHDHGYGTGRFGLMAGEWVYSRHHDLGRVIEVSAREFLVVFQTGAVVDHVRYRKKTSLSLIRLGKVRAPRPAFLAGSLARSNDEPDHANPHPVTEPLSRAAWFAGWVQVNERMRGLSLLLT